MQALGEFDLVHARFLPLAKVARRCNDCYPIMSAMKGVQLLFFSKKVSVPVVLQKSKQFLMNSDREGCKVGSWSAILALQEELSVLK